MDNEREKLYEYADDSQFKGKPAGEIFTEIFNNNTWTDAESVSGIGSSLAQTGEIIKYLPEVIKKYNVAAMLDAPCGDFNWMREVPMEGVGYTGGDIVEELIAADKKKYEKNGRSFKVLNLITDKIDKYDLIFCRDCLVHLSYADIFNSLNNIVESGSKYLMTTTFLEQKINKDIHTGGWRPINFRLSPFNFPEPVYILDEKCTEMDGKFDDKVLALWEIPNLAGKYKL
jgi:hypothetical protein